MIQIIPAIDIIGGKCVRLSQGDFSQVKTYSERPLEVAMHFEAAGLKRVHIVDLDGARSGKVVNLGVLKTISRGTDLRIDFGGGIKTTTALKTVIDAGASFANVGSIAVTDPETFRKMLHLYGPKLVILGADVRDGKIAINGWQTDTEVDVIPFLAEYAARGGRKAFVTDIVRDGVLSGPSFELYEEILAAVPEIELIASGGVSSMDDITELERIGCHGVIIGKAIYEGRITLAELANRPKREAARS